MQKALVFLAFTIAPAFAQPAFEVASLKPDPFKGQGGIGIRVAGNRLMVDHQSLTAMVVFAYGLEDFQVSGGPAWSKAGPMDADAYQLIAQSPAGTTPAQEQFEQMLQALLAERFKLKLHHETKDLPAYELVIGKNGHKLKDAADLSQHTVWNSGAVSKYHGKSVSMHDLAFVLRTQTGRPVIDKTGLAGKYDFELQWASGNPPPPDLDAPSIFTAVQEQIGLRLDPVKAPFDTIVIDSAEKPSPN